MKLKEFPRIKWAFGEIMMDNGFVNGMYIDKDWEVEDYWRGPFRITEQWLREAHTHNASESPLLAQREEYGAMTMEDVLAIPIDDDDEYVLTFLGASEAENWIVRRVLWEFFEGELRDKILKAEPDSQWERMVKRSKRL